MCSTSVACADATQRQPAWSRLEALNLMRDVLSRANINADIADLDRLFHEHWGRLSMLAHAIHGAEC